MKFGPKRDAGLSVVIYACVLVLVIAGLSPFFDDHIGWLSGGILLVVCLMFAGFVMWLWFGIYYVFGDSHLLICTGPIREKIAYGAVTRVEPIRSWLSSAATSSDRLNIRYGTYGSIHVSPLRRREFIEELIKRCPHVEIENDYQYNKK